MPARRKQTRRAPLQTLLLCGGLMLALRLFFPTAQPPVDLPASDEPDAFPLPLVDFLPTAPESSAVSMPIVVVEQPPQPVFTPSPSDYQGTGTVYFKNETDYAIDMTFLLQKDSPVALGEQGVQVLIMHTHGTEA